MRKFIFIGILIATALLALNANTQPMQGITYGECYRALDKIQESLKNDSLVVDYFWKNYKILSDYPQSLQTDKTPAEVILFFRKDENKDMMCIHKRFRGNKVLLDTSNLNQ